MGYCSDKKVADCFGGTTLPRYWSEMNTEKWKSFIEGYLVTVPIKRRTKKNGTLENKDIPKVNKSLADAVKAAFDEIAQNPNVAINNNTYFYGWRHMNSGNSSGNAYATIHCTACACDINHEVNKLHSKVGSEPDDEFRMRTTSHPIVQAFTKQGFAWGGTWKNKDAMHFEYSDSASGTITLSSGDGFNSGATNFGGGGGGGYVSPGKYTPVEWAPPNDGGKKSMKVDSKKKGTAGMIVGIHILQK